MTETFRPKPGDKVRVSFDSVVDNYGHYAGEEFGKVNWGTSVVTKKVIKPYEPTYDELYPVGTIATDKAGRTVIRTAVEGETWQIINEVLDGNDKLLNSYVKGFCPDNIIGAVPGTPAAGIYSVTVTQ